MGVDERDGRLSERDAGRGPRLVRIGLGLCLFPPPVLTVFPTLTEALACLFLVLDVDEGCYYALVSRIFVIIIFFISSLSLVLLFFYLGTGCIGPGST